MFRHLLVPTDGSDPSQTAVDAAVAFAREAGARVTFFHAQDSFFGRPDVALYGEGLVLDPALSEEFSKANREFAQTLLDEAKAKAAAAGVECSGDTVVNPLIHEAIIDAATRHGCDAIVMASHGRRGLAGLLLGSETQRVLTHAGIPVLVWPARSAG
jgi:nucleotide-binding universal stress UspA family protein